MNVEEKNIIKRFDDVSKNAKRYILQNIGLKNKSKKVLELKYIDELSYDEISEILGYDERYVKFILNNAKKEFNKIIKREYKIMGEELKSYVELLIND